MDLYVCFFEDSVKLKIKDALNTKRSKNPVKRSGVSIPYDVISVNWFKFEVVETGEKGKLWPLTYVSLLTN